MKATIPVLDLQDYLSQDPHRQRKFVDDVGAALHDVGFFGLLNHGLDPMIISHGYQLCREFFGLSDDQKRQYYSKGLKGQRGYIPFGSEKAKDASISDLKEFWHVGQSQVEALGYPENIWPAEIAGFQETFTKIFKTLEGCSRSILEACALYLGEDIDLIADYMVQGNSILRLLHYPAVPEDRHPLAVRAAAHEDINLITFLVDATASGLEILGRDGQWIPVVTPPQCVIVDSGDMLANLTNDFYRATTHRVVNPNNSKQERFSMPFFVHPRNDCSLNPLPSCIDRTGGKKLHPDITAGAYLEKRLEELGLDFM